MHEAFRLAPPAAGNPERSGRNAGAEAARA